MPNGLPYSLSTVLGHEMVKFNALLECMTTSLQQLQAAIKGLTVLSETLDAMFQAILHNRVPDVWQSVAYPSLKPLGAWVQDLEARCAGFPHFARCGLRGTGRMGTGVHWKGRDPRGGPRGG